MRGSARDRPPRDAAAHRTGRPASTPRPRPRTQALWLKLAYDLEFLGVDTFHLLWLASLAFFLAHVAVLVAVVSRYRGHPVYAAGRLTTFDRSKTA